MSCSKNEYRNCELHTKRVQQCLRAGFASLSSLVEIKPKLLPLPTTIARRVAKIARKITSWKRVLFRYFLMLCHNIFPNDILLLAAVYIEVEHESHFIIQGRRNKSVIDDCLWARAESTVTHCLGELCADLILSSQKASKNDIPSRTKYCVSLSFSWLNLI